MKTFKYAGGVPGQSATCRYALHVADDAPTLVLTQDPKTTLYLDNFIETIVDTLLAHELLDIDAAKLRVFRLDSNRGWAEIGLDTVARRRVTVTWRQRLLALIGRAEMQPFEVAGPWWDSVEPEDLAMLRRLDPALMAA